MGNVERCDKTLPVNEMIFHVRRDARLQERWKTDLEALANEFGLGRAEYEAIRDKDVRRLTEIGVHQYLIPQILRLHFGAGGNSNASPTLDAYKRAFPEETRQALAVEQHGDVFVGPTLRAAIRSEGG
jgi:aromatic-ring opening dioxygenase LigAB LigA subunit